MDAAETLQRRLASPALTLRESLFLFKGDIMSKGRSPAFQFYPSDFLSDENVVLMSNIEVGCYIKLLCFCWKQGSIPADISKIAKLCNEPDDIMAELWPSIKPCFRNGQPDRLIHPRLDVERKKQERFSKERSESGKKGAEKRWKNKQKDSSAIKEPMAKNGFSSSPSPSSSPSDIKRYGEFENIILTKKELEKLETKFGVSKTGEMIENISEYVKSKGVKYKSHYATILAWDRRDKKKENQANHIQPKTYAQAQDAERRQRAKWLLGEKDENNKGTDIKRINHA